MKLVIDFETYSDAKLKKVGMYKYSEHPSTDINCLAIKPGDGDALLWVPSKLRHLIADDPDLIGRAILINDLIDFIMQADEISAHNLGFEKVIWTNVGEIYYGFPPWPQYKTKCSAALASFYALPRDLDGAGEALDLKQKKDKAGYNVLMRMCKPNRKGERSRDPDDFKALCRYCVQDVEAEKNLEDVLLPLPPKEQEIWQLDQVINDRGIFVDLDAINTTRNKLQRKEKALLKRIFEITDRQVKSPRQVAASLEWLKSRGVDMPNLQKETVLEILEDEVPDNVREFLTIRQMLAKSSVSKLDAMERMACGDERVRGALLYHGTSTGRWAGRGIQPQNMVRDSFNDSEMDLFLSCDDDDIELFFPNVYTAASKSVRGMLCAAPGNTLYAADFSAIEARVLAWLAKEHTVLEAYREGKDIYKINAANTFDIPYDQVTKDQRQVGKVEELSCFAGDTKVLTYTGWTDIRDVKAYHWVWDGEKFVRHGGVVCQGVKPVISCCGVGVTKDHLFLTGEDTWVTAEDLSQNSQDQESAISMASLPLPPFVMDVTGALVRFIVRALAEKPQHRILAILEAVKQHAAIRVRKFGVGSLPLSTTISCLTRETVAGCLVEFLVSLDDVMTQDYLTTPITEDGESESIDLGSKIDDFFCRISQHLKDGLTQAIQLIELIMTEATYRATLGLSLTENNKTIEPITRRFGTTEGDTRRRSFINFVVRHMLESGQFPLRYGAEFLPSRSLKNKNTVEAVTYDILNCGDHNRFTVLTNKGPMLVHNCGYQGWTTAFQDMAKSYGIEFPEAAIEKFIKSWRESRPSTTRYWRAIESCALEAVKNPGKTYAYGAIKFGVRGRFLHCRLPSGRMLAYCDPTTKMVTDKYKRVKESIRYMSVNSQFGNSWMRTYTYGGKLTENIVQAISRDLLVEAMLRVEAAGYPIVFHVHDEVVCELPKDTDKSLDQFIALMSVVPDWAEGMPLMVEGWEGKRYRK